MRTEEKTIQDKILPLQIYLVKWTPSKVRQKAINLADVWKEYFDCSDVVNTWQYDYLRFSILSLYIPRQHFRDNSWAVAAKTFSYTLNPLWDLKETASLLPQWYIFLRFPTRLYFSLNFTRNLYLEYWIWKCQKQDDIVHSKEGNASPKISGIATSPGFVSRFLTLFVGVP